MPAREDMMEFNLKVKTEDIKILSDALVQLPYYQVAELIGRLNQQVQEQQNPNE